MDRPLLDRYTAYVGVDGGYSNLGVVVGRVSPHGSSVLFAMAAKRKNRGHDNDSMRAHCRAMAAIVIQVGESFGWSDLVWGYEDWKGGKSLNTVRWRSYFDGLVLSELDNRMQPVIIVAPSIHKAVLNPLGTATDSGRKTDLEYGAALNSLDTVWTGADLARIANPIIQGDVGNRWKEGRQHSLDAAAICLAVALATRYDDTRGEVAGFQHLPKGQRRAAEKVAQASQIV